MNKNSVVLTAGQEKILDEAVTMWTKGKAYKFEGSYYETGTGSYICPVE